MPTHSRHKLTAFVRTVPTSPRHIPKAIIPIAISKIRTENLFFFGNPVRHLQNFLFIDVGVPCGVESTVLGEHEGESVV